RSAAGAGCAESPGGTGTIEHAFEPARIDASLRQHSRDPGRPSRQTVSGLAPIDGRIFSKRLDGEGSLEPDPDQERRLVSISPQQAIEGQKSVTGVTNLRCESHRGCLDFEPAAQHDPKAIRVLNRCERV